MRTDDKSRDRATPEHTHQEHRESSGHAEGNGEARKKAPHSKKGIDKHVEDLAAEVNRIKAELKEVNDKYLRALADFDNYRKRIARENEERTRCANEELIRRLLDVIDNMERAFAVAEGTKDFEGLRKGIELTYLSLKEILTKEGLCSIKCLGEKFDPNYHEAIMALEKEGTDAENVIEEIQKGYMLNGKLIRPSKVVVSK